MRGPLRESELVEAPPYRAEFLFSVLPCGPLHSPSKTGVNALVASGARCAAAPGNRSKCPRQHHPTDSSLKPLGGLLHQAEIGQFVDVEARREEAEIAGGIDSA